VDTLSLLSSVDKSIRVECLHGIHVYIYICVCMYVCRHMTVIHYSYLIYIKRGSTIPIYTLLRKKERKNISTFTETSMTPPVVMRKYKRVIERVNLFRFFIQIKQKINRFRLKAVVTANITLSRH